MLKAAICITRELATIANAEQRETSGKREIQIEWTYEKTSKKRTEKQKEKKYRLEACENLTWNTLLQCTKLSAKFVGKKLAAAAGSAERHSSFDPLPLLLHPFAPSAHQLCCVVPRHAAMSATRVESWYLGRSENSTPRLEIERDTPIAIKQNIPLCHDCI